MTGHSGLKTLWMLPMVCLSTACLSKPIDIPARLTAISAITMERVTTTLQQALGIQRIDLGPENLSDSTIVSVLPPPLGPYETRSMAQPEVFDIVKRGNACLLVRRTTGMSYPMSGVSCMAIAAQK